MAIFWWGPPNGDVECKGVWKITIFDKDLTLSHRWSKRLYLACFVSKRTDHQGTDHGGQTWHRSGDRSPGDRWSGDRLRNLSPFPWWSVPCWSVPVCVTCDVMNIGVPYLRLAISFSQSVCSPRPPRPIEDITVTSVLLYHRRPCSANQLSRQARYSTY